MNSIQNLQHAKWRCMKSEWLVVCQYSPNHSLHKYQENLFWLAHNPLGHFGTENPMLIYEIAIGQISYILGCLECQRNKPCTPKPPGPLHPLSVYNKQRDCITMDFIGPNDSFNCILTITDRFIADIRIVPCHIDIMGKFSRSILQALVLWRQYSLGNHEWPRQMGFVTIWHTLNKQTGVRFHIPSWNWWVQQMLKQNYKKIHTILCAVKPIWLVQSFIST